MFFHSPFASTAAQSSPSSQLAGLLLSLGQETCCRSSFHLLPPCEQPLAAKDRKSQSPWWKTPNARLVSWLHAWLGPKSAPHSETIPNGPYTTKGFSSSPTGDQFHHSHRKMGSSEELGCNRIAGLPSQRQWRVDRKPGCQKSRPTDGPCGRSCSTHWFELPCFWRRDLDIMDAQADPWHPVTIEICIYLLSKVGNTSRKYRSLTHKWKHKIETTNLKHHPPYILSQNMSCLTGDLLQSYRKLKAQVF